MSPPEAKKIPYLVRFQVYSRQHPHSLTRGTSLPDKLGLYLGYQKVTMTTRYLWTAVTNRKQFLGLLNYHHYQCASEVDC